MFKAQEHPKLPKVTGCFQMSSRRDPLPLFSAKTDDAGPAFKIGVSTFKYVPGPGPSFAALRSRSYNIVRLSVKANTPEGFLGNLARFC